MVKTDEKFVHLETSKHKCVLDLALDENGNVYARIHKSDFPGVNLGRAEEKPKTYGPKSRFRTLDGPARTLVADAMNKNIMMISDDGRCYATFKVADPLHVSQQELDALSGVGYYTPIEGSE